VSARALKTHKDADPQTSSTSNAKFVDNTSPCLAKARFVPVDAPVWTEKLLERRGRLAKESAERRARRRRPAKRPWSTARCNALLPEM
jgi:hypothetical protein